MATQTAPLPVSAISDSAGIVLPAFTLWWRELVRFYRQRARVVGVIASPLVFWAVLGSGFGTSFRSGELARRRRRGMFEGLVSSIRAVKRAFPPEWPAARSSIGSLVQRM